MRDPFYEDFAVYAFPSTPPVIADIDEKALYKREPYTSFKHVKTYLPTAAHYTEPAGGVIAPDKIIDLTNHLKPDGTLEWQVPAGNWTVVRMGRRINGAGTRPAPAPAVGCESDKFDAKAIDFHLSKFVDVLLKKIGPRAKEHGLTNLHMDSWESGAQNWTPEFLEEFKKRRGYDAKPFLLTYTGRAVEGLEKSERFLWDMRLTAQDLVLENHAQRVKQYAHKHGFELSIEPYDMNPAGDLDLGAVADIPMGEFWHNFLDSAYSVFEAVSIAHVMGRPVVAAESFTAAGGLECDPWALKNQGNWAFAAGINRIFFHTYTHQPLSQDYKPGFTLGPHGVHWHRNQTWWPMVGAFHLFIARCSEILQQGTAVSDVLYLTPEGAPHIFLPPSSALEGTGRLADKKGYGFDGCSPRMLMERAEVKDGLIAFPGGTSYRVMVLPQVQTMTPALLEKIRDLVKAGATIVGNPPLKSPSLSGYPACDEKVQNLAKELWGSLDAPAEPTKRSFGQGTIHWGGPLSPASSAQPKSSDALMASQWIWYPEGNPANSAPAGLRYFQRTMEVDAAKTVESATASLSADNEFTLWINGKKVSEGKDFKVPVQSSIASFLRPGANVISVAVNNAGPAASPAGWIGAFEVFYKDGTKTVVNSDAKWSAGLTAPEGWEQSATSPADWKPAQSLGAYAMAPWRLAIPQETMPPLYPDYDLTAAILKTMGVPEDFMATGRARALRPPTHGRPRHLFRRKPHRRANQGRVPLPRVRRNPRALGSRHRRAPRVAAIRAQGRHNHCPNGVRRVPKFLRRLWRQGPSARVVQWQKLRRNQARSRNLGSVGCLVRPEMGRTREDHLRHIAGLDEAPGERHQILLRHRDLSKHLSGSRTAQRQDLPEPRHRPRHGACEAQRQRPRRGLVRPVASRGRRRP